MFLRNIFEALARTGEGKAAVVGWGRGMGHKGHMYLASSVITHANQLGADPYFVVSRTVGKDDPITPDEKLAIYKKVFPEQGHIFQTATDEIPDLTRVLSDLNRQGYTSATIVLGADQVKAFQYLKNYNGKADKAGNVPYTFDKLDVISRQETNDPSKDQEGPRATPMRAVLMDPSKSEEEQFQVWRDAMNPQVSDDEVRDLMMKAKERMQALVKPKKGVAEFAMGDDEEDPTDNYPCYDCGSTIFLHHTKLCELAEDNAMRDLPSKPGSQHWTGEVPKGLHPIPRLAEGGKETSVNELSNNLLGRYKKLAGADANAADKAGNTKRANKRFSGIVKATKKQFATDEKGVAERMLPKSALESSQVPPGGDPKVFALQNQLIAKGAKIKADGKMGPSTQAAMKQFSDVPSNAVRSLDGTLVRTGSGGVVTTRTPAPDPKAVTRAKAKLTPSQLTWLGRADPTDPNIIARMPDPEPGEVPGRSSPQASSVNISSDADIMDMIKQHEGVRNQPYKDTKGLWTVGVGHLIGNGKTLPPEWNRTFTDAEITNIFKKDYQHHMQAAEKIPGFNNLNLKGQAALIDLTFNMGPAWWKKWPNFTKAMQSGNIAQAANELKNSEWYSQVGRRAPKIVSLLQSGGQTVAEGSLLGGMEEGLGSKLAGLGLAGAMALGASGANARVVPGQDDPNINRLTGKPNVTQVAPSNVKPAAAAPAGFNKEYLQSVIDGKHPRPMISKEKAAELLMKMNAVDEAKKKGADGKACWDGYRYNGTENGKDSCVKVSEDVQDVMDALINKIIVNEAIQNNRK